MKTSAAILVETGSPLEIVELEIPVLKPGQVLVEIAFSGVCHTQLLECRGHRGEDKFLPHCLGHEGSGTVLEIGPAVTKVAPGEKVFLSWIKGSGANVPGTVYQWDGKDVNAGAITTFSKHSVISENRLTPSPEGFPESSAALIGCAVATGAGAVLNTGQARAGGSIAIFGTGGIGLCAVSTAVAAGCQPIIAVDVLPAKLEFARKLGATHIVNSGTSDPVQEINNICPGGVELAIEASGRPTVMAQALQSVRAQGGTAVIVGNAHFGENLEIDPSQLNQGKRLLGTWGGDSDPDRDYPRFAKLISSRQMNIEPLIGDLYGFEQVNQALDDLEAGRLARPLIDMSR